jgi:L-lysine 6-transaminase
MLGKHLVDGLAAITEVDNVRGRGLFVALDLPTREERDATLQRLHRDEHVLILGGGERSIRFRPALTINEDELDLAVAAVARAVRG